MFGFNVLLTAINTIFPVVLLILLGYLLRQKGLMTDEFVSCGNKLVFSVFIPATMFINVYDMDGLESIAWDLVGFAIGMTCVLFMIGMVFSMLITKQPGRRGVLLQATFRSNMAIIGISLASTLGGGEAVTAASMVAAFSVAVFNILAVLCFAIFSDDTSPKNGQLKHALIKIIKTPMVIGILLGMFCLLIRKLQNDLFGEVVFSLQEDLTIVYTVVNNLKSVTTPVALLVLGGQFVFSAMGSYNKEIICGTVLRTVIVPLLGLGTAFLLSQYTGLVSFGPNEYPALIAHFGSPVAVSSAVVAAQIGGDEQLATQLVVWTSVASIFTIFLQVCILMGAGLLVV